MVDDHVIVGAGSSGQRGTGRPSAVLSTTVLVRDAGPNYRSSEVLAELRNLNSGGICDAARFPQFFWPTLKAHRSLVQKWSPTPRSLLHQRRQHDSRHAERIRPLDLAGVEGPKIRGSRPSVGPTPTSTSGAFCIVVATERCRSTAFALLVASAGP
jgi:hypothetical protein